MTCSSRLADLVFAQSLPSSSSYPLWRSRVAAIIDYELGALSLWMRERAISAPPIIFQRFAFPGENGDAGLCDRRSGVVLRGENVAACPAHARAKITQRFDQDGC